MEKTKIIERQLKNAALECAKCNQPTSEKVLNFYLPAPTKPAGWGGTAKAPRTLNHCTVGVWMDKGNHIACKYFSYVSMLLNDHFFKVVIYRFSF